MHPGEDSAIHPSRVETLASALEGVVRTLGDDPDAPNTVESVCQAVAVQAATLVENTTVLLWLSAFDDVQSLRLVGTSRANGRTAAREWATDLAPVFDALTWGSPVETVLPAQTTTPERMRKARNDAIRAVPVVTSGGRRLGAMVAIRQDAIEFSAVERHLLDRFAGLVTKLVAQVLAAEASARAHRSAEAASRAKSDFLNIVAHELRSPLTVVSGFASLLAEGMYGPPSERWMEPVEIIASKGDELTKLVDDLLLTSRLESDLLPLTIDTLDLRDAVRDAATRARPRVSLMRGQLLVGLPDAPVHVRADLIHLDRILDNLLNNALTYGGEQPWVRIGVEASPSPAVVVEDHGIGIAPENHERIFERFVRVQEQGAGAGSGLGLYICRQLAARLEGSLDLVHSAPGQGSRFQLRLQGALAAPI